jgi:DNA polymerase-3 subunit alpha
MEKFAGYGFNKSHAAAYALLAYHTAWLKAHHPAEFFAANMTVSIDDTDKLKIFYDDARATGVAFLPPDVNASVHRFEPVDRLGAASGEGARGCVRWGLGAIKGTGQGAIEAIVAAREAAGGGPFRSLYDFCARVDRQRVNKRVVEALIKAGAFDAIEPNRAALLASVTRAFDHADTCEAHADQGGLFDSADFADAGGASTREPDLVHVAAWGVKERLTFEKATLGLYLSGHLLDEHEAEVRRIARTCIADLTEAREPQIVAGVVNDLRVVNGQRGRVAIFRLDDKSDTIESVVNEELLNAHRELLRDDELLIVQGRVQPDRFNGGLRLNVSAVWDLPGARARFGRYLEVEVNGIAPPVARLVTEFPPRRTSGEHGELTHGLAVRLQLHRQGASAELDLGDAARFWPSDEALMRWREVSHGHAARVVYDRS